MAGALYYYASRSGRFDRPAVVFIHGAGGNNRQWPYALRTLPGYRTYAVDLPGHGNSAGAGEQSVPAYADIIKRWALEMGISWAVFVGHSMGGAIALQLALDDGDLTAGLVLVSTGAKLRVAPELMEGFSLDITRSQTVDRLIDMHFSHTKREELQRYLRKDLLSCRRSVIWGDFQACDSFDVTGRLGELGVPTCVLVGEQDQLTPPKYAHFLAEHIPKAQVNIIPDAGHMLASEKPTQVAAVIEDFLARLD